MVRGFFRFSGMIRIGDLIAASAILVSAISVVHALGENSEIARIEARNHQREAAARAIARLDRWKAVQASLKADLQPILISTSEMLRDTGNVARARDYLWREGWTAYAAAERRIVAEQLDTGYESVLIYSPQSRQTYLDAFFRLREVSRATVVSVISDGQQEIIYGDRAEFSDSALMGNTLRRILNENFDDLERRADVIGRPARIHFCRAIVDTEDALRACTNTPIAPRRGESGSSTS